MYKNHWIKVFGWVLSNRKILIKILFKLTKFISYNLIIDELVKNINIWHISYANTYWVLYKMTCEQKIIVLLNFTLSDKNRHDPLLCYLLFIEHLIICVWRLNEYHNTFLSMTLLQIKKSTYNNVIYILNFWFKLINKWWDMSFRSVLLKNAMIW